jgi:NADPH-dependent 2,4-dienoyl-CoA reductase/sulfur reductase-like enzyme
VSSETAAIVTLVALGYRARCTAPRCNKQARVIFRYADSTGRPMSNSEFCSMHARARMGFETIDPQNKAVQLGDRKERKFDALLLATGAEPVQLKVPGADLAHVCYLRTQSDCRAIIAKAGKAKRVVLAGSSFIAMEVASALIHRKLEVHIVAPEEIPMARVLGPEVGAHLRRLHERNGTVFHLQQSVLAIDERNVTLKDGQTINADLVVIGIGVKPQIDLAERASIKTDRGVLVNEYSKPIFHASSPQVTPRWPDPLTGDNIRVEHWVVAERQGQTVARNILGARALRCGAVLLDEPVRFYPQLHRSRRRVG